MFLVLNISNSAVPSNSAIITDPIPTTNNYAIAFTTLQQTPE